MGKRSSNKKKTQHESQQMQPYSASSYSRSNASYAEKRGMSKGKKAAIIVIVILVLMLAIAGFCAFMFLNSVNNSLQDTGKSEEQLAAIDDALSTEEPVTFDEPFYVLLIGSDRRSGDPSMGARSDTNVLVRVDAPNGQITMISIPRDTKIVYNGSTMKFNAAYSYGDVAGVITAAEDLTGAEIVHYAEVNFESLENLVDAVGGVEVDVPCEINDAKAGDYIIEPGLQTLNGEQALEFARSRQYADGDFTRTSNQRLLIESLARQVLDMPITKIPGVIKAAAECVSTDMSLEDIIALAKQIKNGSGLTIYSAMVPSTTGMLDGVSYVFCDTAGLQSMMEIVDAGGDPNTVEASGSIGSAVIEYEDLNVERDGSQTREFARETLY